ncbi:MAG: baseplate J/gp47 family protein [Candidatus Aminicenantes bacterium]|jgi:uncharacterized phage protein gp47/JayE
MTYVKKSYQEVIDDALVKMRGGIVNESHTFIPGESRYVLDQAPTAAVAAVKGTLAGEAYTFSQGEDLDFYLPDENSIQWVGARTPDPDTRFFVSYFPQHRDSPITDVNIGSVTRTLVEAFAWEVAVVYNQLHIVYENAFIDTAEGKSLDFLVKLLDITRIEAGFALGEVTFSRNTPAPADITIPEGTLVSGLSLDENGDEIAHLYKTTEDGTLRRGETSVSIPVRAENKGLAAPTSLLNTMPKPILGIEEVFNRDDTVLGSKAETDEQLRERAKARIKGTSTVTREAILTAMLEKDFVTTADVIDRPGNNNGEIAVVLDTLREEVETEVRERLHAIKAAGVHFELVFTTKVFPEYAITLVTSGDLSDKDKETITVELREGIKAYLSKLNPSAPVIASKIVAIAMGIAKVESAEITDVSVQPKGVDVRRLPNCDLLIGKFHKATANDEIDPVKKITFKTTAVTEEPKAAVEVSTQQLKVEAHIFIKIMDSGLNDLRTKQAIEASTRSYLSNLFYEDGDTVNFEYFSTAVKTTKSIKKEDIQWGKYLVKIAGHVPASLPGETISFEQDIESYTFLRLVHSADGLEKILFDASHEEEIRAGEVIEDPKIYIYIERL